jgi:hypothetical protein
MEVIMMWSIIAIFWVHFIADFICQSDKMALNKSTSFYWLWVHMAAYFIPFLIFSLIYSIIYIDPVWSLYTGIFFPAAVAFLHLCVDYFTSKINSALWHGSESKHFFFCGVGLDQSIHMTINLLLFYRMVVPYLKG